MADIAWQDVLDAFPTDAQLAAMPPALTNVIIERVNTEISATFFGGSESAKFKLARFAMAAHMALTMLPANAAAGPVTAETIDDLSRSYAVTVTGSHASTGYGQTFDDLARSSPYRIGVGC